MIMKPTIYLDYAAATPVHDSVMVAMLPYYTEKFYNPSATYLAAKAVKTDLDTARSDIAAILGARPSEIIFTAGGTEANNLAIKGVLDYFPEANVLVSAVEHESVLAPAQQYDHRVIAVNAQGECLTDNLESLIDDHTVLISVMYANNEVGTIQPIRAVAQIVEKVRKQRRESGNTQPLYLHTDACQAGNYLDLHVSRLGVDLMTINGGKIYGPKQSAVLFVGSHVRFKPLIEGGGQERNIRSGTENIAQAVGLAKALQIAQTHRKENGEHARELQDFFITELKKAIPQGIINGSHKRRLPNNVHITIPGQDNERLIFALDEQGILAAAGSACSASNEEPSHVLRAMGISEADAQASLRFTIGNATTKEDITYTVQTLADLLA